MEEGGDTAFHLRVVLPLLLTAEADNPVGAEGKVEQLLQAPCEVQGWPLPAGPLCVAGSSPCVHQLFL